MCQIKLSQTEAPEKECTGFLVRENNIRRKKDGFMKIEVDTHSHTLASGHAYNTIREMASAAAEKGLRGLAITDHAIEMPGTCHSYYFENLRVVPRQMYGIELLMGTELNILNEDGEVDMPHRLLGEMDIAIASLHSPCYKGEHTMEAVGRAYMNVMENEYVDIIGHPDDGRFPVDFEMLAREARRTGTLLEVNNSSLRPGGFRLNAMENSKKMRAECKKQGTMIVLGTDSHVDVDIAEYPYAFRVLEETDFPEELVANTSLEKLKSSLKHNKNI